MNELQNRFRGKGGTHLNNANNDYEFEVHVEEPSIGGSNKTQVKESELNFYGDHVDFEYRSILDLH
jgi:hypothetical protein